MLRNTVGVSAFSEKSVMKVYGSTLLAVRGCVGGGQISRKKRYVILEWPLTRKQLYGKTKMLKKCTRLHHRL